MESGRHSENSLSTVTEEQEHSQGWDQGENRHAVPSVGN